MRKNIFVLIVLIPVFLKAQNWLPVGSGLRNGNNNDVNVLAEFNGQLIAGGELELIIGTDSIGNIGRFDGTDWRQMGDNAGFNNQVNALAVYNSELYAAGQFTAKYINDGITYNGRIARWDGNSWQPVPGATGNTADALVVWDNKLCMAHNLQGGSINEFRVSCYDGSTWTDLPGEFKGPENYVSLSDLCVYNNNLVVAGRFDSVGTQPIRMVAIWDGTQWLDPAFPVNGRSELSPGLWIIDGYANTCEVIAGELFVGGLFTTYNNVNNEPTGLASWDGSAWTRWNMGDNNSQGISDIVVMGDSIFVLGNFQAYHPVTNELQWGAATFHPDSSYFFRGTNFYPTPSVNISNHNINTGIVFNNNLYVGGDFSHAGTNQVNNITRFDPTPFVVSVSTQVSKKNLSVFPNPFNAEITVIADEPTTVHLFNILGEEVLTLPVSGRTLIAAGELPEGIYLLKTDSMSEVVRMVKH